MKLFFIRRIDTNEFVGRGISNWTKTCPRVFSRRSDLSNHLNQAVIGAEKMENFKYRGVHNRNVEILDYEFMKDDQTFSTLPGRISLANYMTRNDNMHYWGKFNKNLHEAASREWIK